MNHSIRFWFVLRQGGACKRLGRAVLVVAAMLWGSMGVAHAQGLPDAVNLKAEIEAAVAKGEPLVVMVSLEQCPFCIVARRSYLVPLLKQGQPIVQVNMRTSKPLINATGGIATHDALTKTWKIKVVPTLLFLGPGGVEVAERIEGASLPDFYGAYIDERILTGRVKLHTPGSRGKP